MFGGVDVSGITGALAQLQQQRRQSAMDEENRRREREAKRVNRAGNLAGLAAAGGVGFATGNPALAAYAFSGGQQLGRGAAGGQIDPGVVVQSGLGAAGESQRIDAMRSMEQQRQSERGMLQSIAPPAQRGVGSDAGITASQSARVPAVSPQLAQMRDAAQGGQTPMSNFAAGVGALNSLRSMRAPIEKAYSAGSQVVTYDPEGKVIGTRQVPSDRTSNQPKPGATRTIPVVIDKGNRLTGDAAAGRDATHEQLQEWNGTAYVNTGAPKSLKREYPSTSTVTLHKPEGSQEGTPLYQELSPLDPDYEKKLAALTGEGWYRITATEQKDTTPKGATTPTKTAGQKELVHTQAVLGSLRKLQQGYDRETFTLQSDVKNWTRGLLDYADIPLTKESQKDMQKYQSYRREVGNAFNTYAFGSGGKNLTATELERVKLAWPKEDDKPVEFKNKLDSAIIQLEAAERRQAYLLNEGILLPGQQVTDNIAPPLVSFEVDKPFEEMSADDLKQTQARGLYLTDTDKNRIKDRIRALKRDSG